MTEFSPKPIEAPDWVGKRPKALLLGAGQRPNVHQEAARLRPEIEKFVDIVLTDFAFEKDLAEIEADMAIVLGGDGSILRAARQMGNNQVPVVGVNLGKLGFLADLTPTQFLQSLPEICGGHCRVVAHMMLRCSLVTGGKVVDWQIGMNETAILGGPPYSILNIDLYVDSEWATTYSCDGLIISTPVGSTAHNLSAGGPIVRKNLPAFVISPISPHTITVRPVVDTAERVYEMSVREPGEHTSVVLDGNVLWPLTPDDRVRVERAEPQFKLVEAPGHTYYNTLRKKLKWGGSVVST